MELQTNVKTGDLKISETSVTPQPQVIGAEKKEATPEVKPPVKEDLVTRASKVALEQPKPKEDEPIFNTNDIEKIEDPKAKEYAEKAHKEFERTYGKKFQELAAIRKDYETQLKQLQETHKGWSPEKVQALLSDQEFVQAAQQVIGTTQPTGEAEYSALSESEKRTLEDNNKQVKMLMQQNAQLQKQQQDESIKQKYANYAPDYVDLEVQNLLTGKRQATREDIWKVIDYENAVQRAYQLGKQDRHTEQSEKMASVSLEGLEVTNNEDKPQPQKGESDRAFLQRIFLNNLAKKAKH